jgi:hypothetical protein
MGITHFPHGVFATPNIGGSRLIDMWNSENIFFVDGEYGSSSNEGKDPSDSVDIPSTAVGLASRGGTIYVRPKTTVASAQSYYLDNITIPLTKPQLAIIGCGQDTDRPYLGPAVKTTVAGLATPVLTVNASGFLTEGMEWTGTSQSGDVSVIYASNDGTIALTSGLTVRNCTIRNVKGHAVGTGGGIHMETPIFCKIQNVLFKDNLASIVFRSTYAAVNTLLIENCSFNGANTTRDVDIFSNASAGYGLIIDKCIFNDALPNHGVINRFISLATGICGMISNCSFASSNGTTDGLVGAGGSLVIAPTTVFSVNNMIEDLTEDGTGTMTRA